MRARGVRYNDIRSTQSAFTARLLLSCYSAQSVSCCSMANIQHAMQRDIPYVPYLAMVQAA